MFTYQFSIISTYQRRPCPRVFSKKTWVTEGVKVSCKWLESMTPQTKAFSAVQKQTWIPRPCFEIFQGTIYLNPLIFYQSTFSRTTTSVLLNCDSRMTTMWFQREILLKLTCDLHLDLFQKWLDPQAMDDANINHRSILSNLLVPLGHPQFET